MRLDNNLIHRFFLERGISHIHHANTLATSLTFLKNDGLHSRGQVEQKGLFQTLQDSDEDDIRNDVWNDIFFDTVDLHGHFPRQNLYGPVLFKYEIRTILNPDLHLYITKNNPMFWKPTTTYNEKYFMDMDDINNNWNKYELQRKMLTIKNPINALPFNDLTSITLDNPNVIIYGDTDLFDEAKKALTEAIPLNHRLNIRKCGNCFCESNYLRQYGTPKLAKYFLPTTHRRFMNS